MHFNLLTLFPDMFPGALGQSLAGRALERGLWSFDTINIRDFATDTHKTVDDTPYGGGAGMVMRPDIIEHALNAIAANKRGRLIYLSPRGQMFNQSMAKSLSAEPAITLLCGRYEGVDQRVLDAHGFEEVSLGDYILSGGEAAALPLMDSCIRLIPGVMGNAHTVDEESFSNGLLEYPHYTKPAEWTDSNGQTHSVPAILKSGNHAKVNQWRDEQSRTITQERRPDLIK